MTDTVHVERERLLNVIERSLGICPACHCHERQEVYQLYLRWECGHTRLLPPIGATRPGYGSPLGQMARRMAAKTTAILARNPGEK
jgi:hypothetical protein